jgi:NAD(P)H-dependent flavin oxidoreductase YrpB (nitropropane dioxygenase family)
MDLSKTISRRRMIELAAAGGAAAVPLAMLGSSARARGRQQLQAGDSTPGSRLTAEYGVELPFVGAGMAFVSTAPLVAAVSNAGGLGVLGASPNPPPLLQSAIEQIKSLTSRPFGVDFINATSALGPFTTDDHISVCIAEGVRLVVFFWNAPQAAWVKRLHNAGAKVWMQVGSVQDAVDAVTVGADAIIAQGIEAGGHNKSTAPLRELLPSIIEALQPTLVLAAGGIATGRDARAAFELGADAVWVGTRLVATEEAFASDDYKLRIVGADSADNTVRTTMFGPEWPNQPIRVLRNRVVNQWAGIENKIPNPPPPPAVIGQTLLFGQPYQMPKFSAIVPTRATTGDFEEMCMPGGESVARIHGIRKAADIVQDVMAGAGCVARGSRVA